jgi:hypothetical protein
MEEGIQMLAGTTAGEHHYSLPCGTGFKVDRNMELFKRTKRNFSFPYRGAAEKVSFVLLSACTVDAAGNRTASIVLLFGCNWNRFPF